MVNHAEIFKAILTTNLTTILTASLTANLRRTRNSGWVRPKGGARNNAEPRPYQKPSSAFLPSALGMGSLWSVNGSWPSPFTRAA